MINVNTDVGLCDLSAERLEPPIPRFILPTLPANIDELVSGLRTLGNEVSVSPFENAGERLFAIIDRVSLNGTDCIVKLVGAEPEGEDPEAGLFAVKVNGVAQERVGLMLAQGLTPRLMGEVVVNGVVAAIFREFADGEPLCDAIAQGRISIAEAMAKSERLAPQLAAERMWLWDMNPSNLWLKPDGSVILLEGQCLLPSHDGPDILAAANLNCIRAMFPDKS